MWHKSNTPPSSVDKDLESKLKEAVNTGNTVAFKRLVKGGVDVNAKYRFNSSLLHEAVQSGKLELVEILLQNKADVNKTNDGGRTALHFACRRGLLKCVQLLVKFGANPDLQTEEGQTALHIAVWRGKGEALDLVKSLVEAGASINLKDRDGWLPIHWASKLNYISIVKYLIEQGSFVNLQAGKAAMGSLRTPFLQALTNSNIDLAKLLLLHGADVNACNGMGQSSVEIVLHDKDIPEDKKVLCVHFLYEFGFRATGNSWMKVKQSLEKLTNQNFRKYSLLDSENLDQSLASLCRSKVRSHMRTCTEGRSIVSRLRNLPLPKVLIEYVTFAEELKKLDGT